MNIHIQQNRLQKIERLKLVIFLTIIAVGFLILIKVDNMLLSFLLAFVLKYTLSPLINYAERRRVKRSHATLIVFTLFFGLIGFFIYWMLPYISVQFKAFDAELPRYIEGTRSLIFDIQSRIEEIINTSMEFNLSAQSEKLMVSWTKSFFQDLPNFLSKSLTTILLAPFFAYFLLKDSHGISKKLLDLVPNSFFELALSLQYQINEQMGQFIRARLLEATIVGLIVWAGLCRTYQFNPLCGPNHWRCAGHYYCFN